VTSRFIESSESFTFDKLILSDEEFQEWVSEMNQTQGVDLLSAPSVILKDGQPGKIEIIREFVYPNKFDPPEFPEDLLKPTTPPHSSCYPNHTGRVRDHQYRCDSGNRSQVT